MNRARPDHREHTAVFAVQHSADGCSTDINRILDSLICWQSRMQPGWWRQGLIAHNSGIMVFRHIPTLPTFDLFAPPHPAA
ncbi:MAG: hypothetical protein A2289_23520 [Deltaproteobacteria bacterium RIFOXYA12_FULL_58_15]|nr:MAG: hypothetical protein A2289_23520 [Deltaproteobacteria bacterium RIFOXYA12_FULL_58_15]OGR10433.1 MAG: hypothetical protein A2341_08825 [Deltaproteobacteria bacterium RIFOXYB12_FULL_58_9]